MSEIYMTEEEQIERIKKWFKEYGTTVIMTVIVVLIFSFAWQYWRRHEAFVSASASELYEDMMISYMSNQNDVVVLKAKHILQEYPATPYASLAALTIAHEDVSSNNLPNADKNLKWVIAHTHSQTLKQVAEVRDARILLAQGKPNDALDILKGDHDKSFQSYIQAVEGDIYMSLNNKSAAKNAYQNAVNGLPANDAIRPIVKMKLAEIS